ncbi:MAG: DivIVA domain-containing protein [Actinomycetes bacterium]
MSYSPVELRHVQVARSFLGYKRKDVEQILDEIADSFENVWRERGELADKVEDLQNELEILKRTEKALTHTLIAADQAATEVREQAKREAEVIVAEAYHEARSVTRAAQGERERLFTEARRVEALLRSALGLVSESATAARPAQAPAASAPTETTAEWLIEDTLEDTRPVDVPLVGAAPAESPTLIGPEAPPRLLRRVAGDEGRDFDWGE